jgi:hypothetical protein
MYVHQSPPLFPVFSTINVAHVNAVRYDLPIYKAMCSVVMNNRELCHHFLTTEFFPLTVSNRLSLPNIRIRPLSTIISHYRYSP